MPGPQIDARAAFLSHRIFYRRHDENSLAGERSGERISVLQRGIAKKNAVNMKKTALQYNDSCDLKRFPVMIKTGAPLSAAGLI